MPFLECSGWCCCSPASCIIPAHLDPLIQEIFWYQGQGSHALDLVAAELVPKDRNPWLPVQFSYLAFSYGEPIGFNVNSKRWVKLRIDFILPRQNHVRLIRIHARAQNSKIESSAIPSAGGRYVGNGHEPSPARIRRRYSVLHTGFFVRPRGVKVRFGGEHQLPLPCDPLKHINC